MIHKLRVIESMLMLRYDLCTSLNMRSHSPEVLFLTYPIRCLSS